MPSRPRVVLHIIIIFNAIEYGMHQSVRGERDESAQIRGTRRPPRGISPHFVAVIFSLISATSISYPEGDGIRVTSSGKYTAAEWRWRPNRHPSPGYSQAESGTGQRNANAHKAESLHLDCMVSHGLIPRRYSPRPRAACGLCR